MMLKFFLPDFIQCNLNRFFLAQI